MKCEGKIRSGERQGQPCKKNAIKGRRFCAQHGGKTRRGREHPNFKHGKRSHYLAFSQSLTEKYFEALEDPELLSLRDQLALLVARRREILLAGESGLLWKLARREFRQYKEALKTDDDAAIKASLDTVEDLLERGHEDSLRWAEVYELIDLEGRTTAREINRLVLLKQWITIEDHLAVMNMLVGIITSTVQDTDTLRKIVHGIDAMISQPTGQEHPRALPKGG